MTTIMTPDLKAVGTMALAVMSSTTRVGRVLGDPGTGKTMASRYLATLQIAVDARPVRIVRLCCRRGWSEAAMVRRVAEALGAEPRAGMSTDAIVDACEPLAADVLLVLDEANHLRWQHLERLRYLSDECGAGLILVGTDLLHRTFIDGRNAVYLAQLARRIGSRQVRMSVLDAKQIAAYILVPRFGEGAGARPLATPYHQATGGYWGESIELAEGCQRILDVRGGSLDLPVIEAAVRDLAERRQGRAPV